MPKVSRESAAQVENHGPVEDRHEDLDDYTVDFVSIRQTHSLAALLAGLPGDACQCPHWGYMFNGKLSVSYTDQPDEVYEAGDAFYITAGHNPLVEAGTEYVQFSPSNELHTVSDVMTKNAQALGMG